jgi:hypothetical protein
MTEEERDEFYEILFGSGGDAARAYRDNLRK